jgi:hypothetical protein
MLQKIRFVFSFLTKKTENYRYRNYCPCDPLHISCICSIWKILYFYSSFYLNPSKFAFFDALTLSLLTKKHMLFIFSKQWNSYAAKDTICVLFFDKKDRKLSLSELLSMMTRIQFNPTLFIWPSIWTRLEHANHLRQ